MLELLLKTDTGVAGLLLRCLLAVAIFPHGAQKVLGWFGGFGVAGTLGYFKGLGIPTSIGVLGIVAEFLGPLMLIAGVGTRVAAFGIACMMLGAVWLVHRPYGFFINWFGQHPAGKEGFEYQLLALGVALVLIVIGGGRWSLDGLLTRGS
ncbi:MAG: DoxX family protein [Gemmatimonadales bacterium]